MKTKRLCNTKDKVAQNFTLSQEINDKRNSLSHMQGFNTGIKLGLYTKRTIIHFTK